MLQKNKKYSYLIRPLFILIDLIIIFGVIFFIKDTNFYNFYFLIYSTFFWLIIAFNTKFYKVYRFTSIFKVFKLLFIQFLVFTLGFFTYFTVFKEGLVVHNQFLILTSTLTTIAIVKLLSFYALKAYRLEGKNYRNVVILGLDDTSEKITNFFKDKTNLGYRFFGFFSDKKNNHKNYLGQLKDSFKYILENNIDELYCTLSTLNKNQIKEFTKFANQHNKVIKLIPDSTELYSKDFDSQYYNNILVFNVKKLPFETPENHFIKRGFDIVFSMFVIIFLLSWVIPLLWVLIKLESKGPLLFKQEREGLNGYHFICYKFRSMKLNKKSDQIHAVKGDQRITQIGKFMRKTSLDELPQFFNVLKGDMSVVGPRPHMQSLAFEYQKDIENYLERHAVKPGITGLAQISGYRGEVIKKADIKNRIRLDIFYIENWSFFLDLKIIVQTVLNVFKGEEKAY
jgi:putative colanic acid biosynthesis UDP-glucose lipid carrier transferase